MDIVWWVIGITAGVGYTLWAWRERQGRHEAERRFDKEFAERRFNERLAQELARIMQEIAQGSLIELSGPERDLIYLLRGRDDERFILTINRDEELWNIRLENKNGGRGRCGTFT
jgi:hypothetical protein